MLASIPLALGTTKESATTGSLMPTPGDRTYSTNTAGAVTITAGSRPHNPHKTKTPTVSMGYDDDELRWKWSVGIITKNAPVLPLMLELFGRTTGETDIVVKVGDPNEFLRPHVLYLSFKVS